MLDRNKTDLTHRITAVAAAYLCGIGCKPVETEVSVARGWVADVASFTYPTMTECKNARLMKFLEAGLDDDKSGRHWNRYSYLINRFGSIYTCLVEVKISRGDFRKDIIAKFGGQFPAHLCYLAYPSGVIKDDEIPKGWVGLKCSADGGQLNRVMGYPTPHAMHLGDVTDFVASVAIRRDHRTAYAARREFFKCLRAGRGADDSGEILRLRRQIKRLEEKLAADEPIPTF